MKLLLLVIVSAFVQAASAQVSLSCKQISCKDVEKPVNASSWCDGDSLPQSEISLGALSSGTTSLNISDDGDQYQVYKFRSNDLRYVRSGDVVQGTYTDGYDWDRYYIRFVLILECTVR